MSVTAGDTFLLPLFEEVFAFDEDEDLRVVLPSAAFLTISSTEILFLVEESLYLLGTADEI